VALVVALILLVVLTLLGLSSVRTVALEERITANTFDRSLAFQAAEAALRVGEIAAQAQAGRNNAGFDSDGEYSDSDDQCGNSPCQNGLCSIPDKDCPARWVDQNFDGWVDAAELGLGALATTPQYIVEYLGEGFPCDLEDLENVNNKICRRYRVTARSHSGGDRAMVILQSIYATE